MKMEMSTLDLLVTVKELQPIVGYKIANIYRIGNAFFFKLQGKGPFKNPFLVIEPQRRVHFTEYSREFPSRPDNKTTILRQLLRDGYIRSVQQVDFDRLLKLEISREGKDYLLICEIFRRGNFIIVDQDNRIVFALWYRRMKDRDILPGKPFELPPSKNKSLLELDESDFDTLPPETSIVRALARTFGGGGELAEEILRRANVDKKKPVNQLTTEDKRAILTAIKTINEELEQPQPELVKDENGEYVSFHPISFQSVSGKKEKYEHFYEVLDKYFLPYEHEHSEELFQKDKEIKRLEKVKEGQERHLAELMRQKDELKEIGDLIFAHYNQIEELFQTIKDARRRNISWEVILQKLEEAKRKQIPSALILEKLNPKKASALLKLDGKTVELTFTKSISEQAETFYQKAKKAQRKIEPAKKALEKTIQQLEEVKKGKQLILSQQQVVVRRRKRAWYEKFHWTFSTHGMLILGGKDVKTNELLAKRYLHEKDLFFHADLPGAPYTILKCAEWRATHNDEVPQEDIMDAAHLAAVFSRGWKAKYGDVDVYYVNGNQVSFTAPSGEYIPRGGIMVRGERTYQRHVPLIWFIGLKIFPEYCQIISGPEHRMQKEALLYVKVIPGEHGKGTIAKKIFKFFNGRLKKEDQVKLSKLNLNEIVEHIPGDSEIKEVFENRALIEQYNNNQLQLFYENNNEINAEKE